MAVVIIGALAQLPAHHAFAISLPPAEATVQWDEETVTRWPAQVDVVAGPPDVCGVGGSLRIDVRVDQLASTLHFSALVCCGRTPNGMWTTTLPPTQSHELHLTNGTSEPVSGTLWTGWAFSSSYPVLGGDFDGRLGGHRLRVRFDLPVAGPILLGGETPLAPPCYRPFCGGEPCAERRATDGSDRGTRKPVELVVRPASAAVRRRGSDPFLVQRHRAHPEISS